MSLTRKFLSAMGIEDDKAEQIITAHLETVGPLKQERDEYKEKAGQLDSVQKDLNTANTKLKEFEDSKGKDSWKVKYDAAVEEKKQLQKDFDDYKADISSKELKVRKSEAYKNLLKDAGVPERLFDSILKVTNLDDKKIAEDGKLEDSEGILTAIKSEWAGFIGSTTQQGAQVSNPPSNDGGSGVLGNVPSRAAKLAAQYHNNLYGKTKED